MKVIVRKPRLTSRHSEILRFVGVALAAALTVVGLGFVGSYAGASAACVAAVGAVGLGRPLREIRDDRASEVRTGDDLWSPGRGFLPVVDTLQDDRYVEITTDDAEAYGADELVTVRRVSE
ncbi:hypothetical protein [Pseudonocardia hydrocarbonoxydans]|uniref:Uncharacterized protein n=1 Tax=Pseudonocardia hydrocarbonoxydans TaxID=76726 RepID=A0A4Y3WSN2_9PSEU|nr:hypothetical protein [Pseudonocardia hydrocarbonoxydans]GEC21855.1 hypothetical protein PHY01_41380 [Pseudonocardia hydrocarbonoxydans]